MKFNAKPLITALVVGALITVGVADKLFTTEAEATAKVGVVEQKAKANSKPTKVKLTEPIEDNYQFGSDFRLKRALEYSQDATIMINLIRKHADREFMAFIGLDVETFLVELKEDFDTNKFTKKEMREALEAYDLYNFNNQPVNAKMQFCKGGDRGDYLGIFQNSIRFLENPGLREANDKEGYTAMIAEFAYAAAYAEDMMKDACRHNLKPFHAAMLK